MPDDPGGERGSDRPIRVLLGPLTPLLRSMLVELLASDPEILLVEGAPLDVLLLEAGDLQPPHPTPGPNLAGQVEALAVGLSGVLLMEPAGRHALMVRIVREHLDLAANGRIALLAAIRRAAQWAEPERAEA